MATARLRHSARLNTGSGESIVETLSSGSIRAYQAVTRSNASIRDGEGRQGRMTDAERTP